MVAFPHLERRVGVGRSIFKMHGVAVRVAFAAAPGLTVRAEEVRAQCGVPALCLL